MFAELMSRLKKYPTATAAMIFSALFSFVLAWPEGVRNVDFYPVWMIALISGVHVWFHLQEDISYRVSGIVPAWIELAAGFVLLFKCPVREVSLVLVVLAVCSYTGGIIFSFRMAVPVIIYLLAAPRIEFCSRCVERAADYFTPVAFNMLPDASTVHLFWWMMLIAVGIAYVLYKTPASRSFACFWFPFVYAFCDSLRRILLAIFPAASEYRPVLFFVTLAVMAIIFWLIQKAVIISGRNARKDA